MGAENAIQRQTGPWSLEEGVALFKAVCTATGIKAMRSSMLFEKAKPSATSAERFTVDEARGKLTVYQLDKVALKEVLPHLIKPKRAFNNFVK